MFDTHTEETRVPAYRRAPEEKREKLMRAASELFAARGYDGTSTIEIAKRAGVSEGILFHHFGSKRALFARLAADYAHAVATATLAGYPDQMTEESVVRSYFDFAERNPALHQLFIERGPAVDLGLTPSGQLIVRTIQAKLELGMKRGEVRPGNALIIAQLQAAVVDAAYRSWKASNDPSRKQEYISEAVRSLKAMMAPVEVGPNRESSWRALSREP